MNWLGFFQGAALCGVVIMAGCATPPKATPSAPAAVAPPAPVARPATLADQIQQAIRDIDEVLDGYGRVLTRIQQLPESRDPGKVMGEVGTYVASDRLAVSVVPPDAELVAGISAGVSVSTWLAVAESELLTELVAVSKRLIQLNEQTGTLAESYEQGRTLQKYAGKIRRELMPLMAELRRLALADKADSNAIARLEAETRKIVAASRLSLQTLEHDTRAIENELGGRQ